VDKIEEKTKICGDGLNSTEIPFKRLASYKTLKC
jgi:hypothetical protein